MAGLTRAEKHGKRQDKSSAARKISDDQALSNTGLDLNDLYREHVADAFIPKANSKAMHLILQFPKDLVDGSQGDWMLEHAREFTKRVFGDQAIFADRLDRDEKSQHVADVFVAPKYLKKTKQAEKMSVSMTRHLKQLAKKHGHPPLPYGIGRALQDELVEYFREIGLEGVQRGGAKEFAGDDWKTAEQLRSEELDRKAAELEQQAKKLETTQNAVQNTAIELGQLQRKLDEDQWELNVGKMQLLSDKGQLSLDRERLEEDRSAFNLEMSNERASIALERLDAEAEIAQERQEAADAKEAGEKEIEAGKDLLASEREQLGKERRDFDLEVVNKRAEIAQERLDAEAEIERDRTAFGLERTAGRAEIDQERKEAAKATIEAQKRSEALIGREKVIEAMERGLDAIENREILKAGNFPDGGKGFGYSKELEADEQKRTVLENQIRPAWDRLWAFAQRMTARLQKVRAAYVAETEARRKAAEELLGARNSMSAAAKAAAMNVPGAAIQVAAAQKIIQQPVPMPPPQEMDAAVLAAAMKRGGVSR